MNDYDWVTDGYTVSRMSPVRECLDKGRCEEDGQSHNDERHQKYYEYETKEKGF